MTTLTLESDTKTETPNDIYSAIQSACSKIAPLWPLKNFVAVNPFIGMSDLKFKDACRLIRKIGHGDMTLDPEFYKSAFERGEITPTDLAESIQSHEVNLTQEQALNALSDPWDGESVRFSVADALDKKDGSRWLSLVVDEFSKWMAAYYDNSQTMWTMPWRGDTLFPAWKKGAEMDRAPEVAGIKNFRSTVLALPNDPVRALKTMCDLMEIPHAQRSEYFHRILMTVRGWAGYVQYLVRENAMKGKEDDSLIHALAIRMAYDFALAQSFGPQEMILNDPFEPEETHTVPILAIWQDALEISHRRGLFQRLKHATSYAAEQAPVSQSVQRPKFQAVFCIDVRSEVFRRALEGAEPESETIGFAGFFGFPIAVKPLDSAMSQARCPVLLSPGYQVAECACGEDHFAGAATKDLVDQINKAHTFKRIWKSFKTSSVSCFSFVESLGLAYMYNLIRDSLALGNLKAKFTKSLQIKSTESIGIPFKDQVDLAQGALKNMGLTQNFGRLVLICGHGSQTTNNPFGSSLDCGACGGHAGDANARVAAMVLNQKEVRQALLERGLNIPEDTWFVAGLHRTISDEVDLFETESVPVSHQQDLLDLKLALKQAGETARLERSVTLGLKTSGTKEALKSAIESRSKDWAQVRPEWGLAGNYAFIAAPRDRTRHLKLDGRAFLHNYDPNKDSDFSTLELILTAPMVVANWINLQYFGSAANNELFGSGDKTLHNVVGKIGTLEGNGGDLRPGLPWQSVHTGDELAHLPLRLNVIVEAPSEAIDKILDRHENVRALVENQWLYLHIMQDQGLRIERRMPDGGWTLVD